jgi:hypothetical protein
MSRREHAQQRMCPLKVDYLITSSARASSVDGTSRPSAAFAVLRLIAISNLVGCSTGRSAGRAPFGILSTKNAPRYQRSLRFTPYPIKPPSLANSVKPIEGRRLLIARSAITMGFPTKWVSSVTPTASIPASLILENVLRSVRSSCLK